MLEAICSEMFPGTNWYCDSQNLRSLAVENITPGFLHHSPHVSTDVCLQEDTTWKVLRCP